MTRTYRPTGRRPGRQSLKEKLVLDLSQKKSVAARRLRKQLEGVEEVPLPIVALAQEAVQEVAHDLGQVTTYKKLDSPLDVKGETAEEQTDSAVSEMLRRMHYSVPAAVLAALKEDPASFVKTYLELIQYKIAKLSKQEFVGNVNHNIGVFVPVEQRAIDTAQGEDGVYAAPQTPQA